MFHQRIDRASLQLYRKEIYAMKKEKMNFTQWLKISRPYYDALLGWAVNRRNEKMYKSVVEAQCNGDVKHFLQELRKMKQFAERGIEQLKGTDVDCVKL